MSSFNQSLLQFIRPASERTISVLSEVATFVDDRKFATNWMMIEHEGWTLPATKEKHDWCGMWQTFGCLNGKLHEMLGKGRRVYIKQYQRSCYRALCKECFLKWIARQSNKSTRRIEKYADNTGKLAIHLMVMVPNSQRDLPFVLIKKRMMEILKIAKWDGGAVVFHPFKFNRSTRQWYYSPHFHLVGFGDQKNIAQAYGKYGWFLKVAEERRSIFQTFCYILSHCGIKKGVHTMTWIGNLSYSKLHVEKEPKITNCPVCGAEFVEVYYEGLFHPIVPPDKPYEGLVDSDGWYLVKPIPELEISSNNYEYHPTREVNEVLKGLTVLT